MAQAPNGCPGLWYGVCVQDSASFSQAAASGAEKPPQDVHSLCKGRALCGFPKLRLSLAGDRTTVVQKLRPDYMYCCMLQMHSPKTL